VKNQLKTVGIIGKFDITGELITDMAYFSTTSKLFCNAEQKTDESLPEVIEFLLLHKMCQTWTLVFVYQGCHIQIRMNCAKNYGYKSLTF